jgi:hypothetical protein
MASEGVTATVQQAAPGEGPSSYLTAEYRVDNPEHDRQLLAYEGL